MSSACARIALEAGADGITVHPRPDGRHVRAPDVAELAALMRALAGRGIQHRGQSVPWTDGLRAAGAAAPMHVRSGRNRGIHVRSWLGSCAGQSDELRPMIAAGKIARCARQLVHGSRCRPRWARRGAAGATGSSCIPSRMRKHSERRSRLGDWRGTRRRRRPHCASVLGVNAGHDLNRDNLGRVPSCGPRRVRKSRSGTR